MRRHRESVGDGKVGCVVLCAWATAESGTGTRDGDANARALLREATTTANGAGALADASREQEVIRLQNGAELGLDPATALGCLALPRSAYCPANPEVLGTL